MDRETLDRIMPTFAGLSDPFSVAAARVVRAGQIRRLKGLARQRTQEDVSQRSSEHERTAQPFVSGNALERGTPPTSLQPAELASFFQRWWPVVRRYTDTDRARVESILTQLWLHRDLPGDIAECGSYKGGTGFLLAFAVREWALPKRVHLFDSWQGLPPLTGEDVKGEQETYFYQGLFDEKDLLANARAFATEHGLAEIIEFHKGWFEETLPRLAPAQQYCLAHIDCDLYAGAKTCWTHLLPHMSSGAVVIVDDYESAGMYRATWELLHAVAEQNEGRSYALAIGALKQAHFEALTTLPLVEGAEDWCPLLQNRAFCATLAGLCSEMLLVCYAPAETPRDQQLLETLERILGAEQIKPFLEYLIGFLYQVG